MLAFRLADGADRSVPIEEAVDAELLCIDRRLAHGDQSGVLGLELGGHMELRHADRMGLTLRKLCASGRVIGTTWTTYD